jgi:hypothetical protein
VCTTVPWYTRVSQHIFKTVYRLLCIYVAIEEVLIINEEFYP